MNLFKNKTHSVHSSEIWESYPDKNSFEWITRGKILYDIALKYESDKKESNKNSKVQVKEDYFSDKTLSELRVISLSIQEDYISKFPNTWDKEIKKDKRLKLINKKILKLKEDGL